MIIGVPKEIKNNEFRVGLTPDAVSAYVQAGHPVFVESGAGEGSSYSDQEYVNAGAQIAESAEEVWTRAEMIVKVKEPIACEYRYFRKGMIIYTYFHLAADEALTKALLEAEVKAVAYETILDDEGKLPCLIPMSEIAGRMAVQQGAKYLEKTFGGRGVLLGGVPGVEKGNVVILGGGVAGTNACKIALGMGANVTVLDVNLRRLEQLDDIFQKQITTIYSTRESVRKALSQADLVICAVLAKPGYAAPKVVKREDLAIMKPGAVIVDIVVDQGGCVETTHPTTHADPVFTVDGIVHYCVANIPGAVARTSTQALLNATLTHGLALAGKGMEEACLADPNLMAGVNCYGGKCTCFGVSEALGIPYTDPTALLSRCE